MARTTFKFPQGYTIYMEGKKGEAVGYWTFPAHPPRGTSGSVARSIRLSDIIDAYNGPDLVVDLDADGVVIGVEVFE